MIVHRIHGAAQGMQNIVRGCVAAEVEPTLTDRVHTACTDRVHGVLATDKHVMALLNEDPVTIVRRGPMFRAARAVLNSRMLWLMLAVD